jgi:hypothetical protein
MMGWSEARQLTRTKPEISAGACAIVLTGQAPSRTTIAVKREVRVAGEIDGCEFI